MKRLDYSATHEEVANTAQELYKSNPDKFEFKLRKDYHFNIVHFCERVNSANIGIVTDHYDPPCDADCVDENESFIDWLNRYVDEYNGCLEPPAIDWDRRRLTLVCGELNSWSKDPSTKVSAGVFQDKYPIAMSYNGFPPGIKDTQERLNDRELKYKLVQHAEANAISTCAKLGIQTNGCTMAISHYPCSTCAGLMLGAGIAKVIVRKPTEDFLSRWKDSIELSKSMFKEAGVELIEIDLDEDY